MVETLTLQESAPGIHTAYFRRELARSFGTRGSLLDGGYSLIHGFSHVFGLRARLDCAKIIQNPVQTYPQSAVDWRSEQNRVQGLEVHSTIK